MSKYTLDKYSVLNEEDMLYVKNNILNVNEDVQFKFDLVDFINTISSNEDDRYFIDMLPFLRFLKNDGQTTAYTDPHKMIYMNAPGIITENYNWWNSIYDHECLHQLWDTFGVEAKLRKDGHDVNHTVMNYASDCVINDYLINIRRRKMPDGLITPEYIKTHYGVIYDRKVDTQYTLYLKLMEVQDKIKNDPNRYQQQEQNGPKIQPKQVTIDPNGGGGGWGGPPEKHSPEYIKGYSQAINDAANKTVDPLNYSPKNPTNDYDRGYNDAMTQIKNGLEKGIKISNNNNNGGGNSGDNDLPEIPWDIPSLPTNNQPEPGDSNGSGNDSSDQSGDVDDSDNSSNGSGNDARDAQHEADKAQQEANDAKNDAEQAQDFADAAKEAADQMSEDGDPAASKAQKAAEEAQEAADEAKEAAEAAQDAADEAQEAADKAREAQANGDKKIAKSEKAKAKQKAKEAKKHADDANKSKSKSQSSSGAGSSSSGAANTTPVPGQMLDEGDPNEISKKSEETIRRYANKISGVFGEFVAKCKSSWKAEESGLATNIDKGTKGFNQKVAQIVRGFVSGRVNKFKRQFVRTYHRVKRGTGPIEFGKPLQKGKEIIKKTMPIKVGLYVDVSGSMSGVLDDVVNALYTICESLKSIWGRDKVIDEISFKIFTFSDTFKEVKYGGHPKPEGGTPTFEEISNYVLEQTSDCMINIILTDGEFGGVNEGKVLDDIKELEGLTILIVNSYNKQFADIERKSEGKLKYVEADPNFTLK